MAIKTILATLAAALALAGAARGHELPRSFSAAPTGEVAFDLYLPLTHAAELEALLAAQQRPGAAEYHRWLTPAQFAARFGMDTAQAARVATALRAAGLRLARTGSHSFRATGARAAVEHALGLTLRTGLYADGHARLVADHVPTLAGAVVAHFAPVEHMRRHALVAMRDVPLNRASTLGAYWFDDLKQAYHFPSYRVANGAGSRIGILMAADYAPYDMALYFGHEGLAPPAIREVAVDGGAAFSSASLETSLDLQQSGGMAPGAALTLFNVPDLSDASLLAGLVTAVEGNAVDIVSMSFGGPELDYTAAYNAGTDETGILGIYDDLFKQGNAQGITFVAAAGDLGAFAIPAPACFATGATSACGGFRLSVEMPASSPHVTAVGGTNLATSDDAGTAYPLRSIYVGENANPDPMAQDIFFGTPALGGYWGSGGGVSIVFAQPTWQAGLSPYSATHRLVPDIAFQMGGCPSGAVTPCGANRSSVVTVLGGQAYGVIGTSAGAPAIAGLFALKVQLTGNRLGNENPDLYAQAAIQAGGPPGPFHQKVAGTDGKYRTKPGYNLVLGVGTPVANVFLGVGSKPAAGDPQSPSNP